MAQPRRQPARALLLPGFGRGAGWCRGSLLGPGAGAQRCSRSVGRTAVSVPGKYPLEGTVRSRVGAWSRQPGRRAGAGSSGCRASLPCSPQHPSQSSQPRLPMPSASLLVIPARAPSSPPHPSWLSQPRLQMPSASLPVIPARAPNALASFLLGTAYWGTVGYQKGRHWGNVLGWPQPAAKSPPSRSLTLPAAGWGRESDRQKHENLVGEKRNWGSIGPIQKISLEKILPPPCLPARPSGPHNSPRAATFPVIPKSPKDPDRYFAFSSRSP